MGWARVKSLFTKQKHWTGKDNTSMVWLHGTILNLIVSFPAPVLGQEINIRTTWRGFPPAITAAVSVPTTAEPEGYRYYVFSGSKSHTGLFTELKQTHAVWQCLKQQQCGLCCSTSEAQHVLHVSIGIVVNKDHVFVLGCSPTAQIYCRVPTVKISISMVMHKKKTGGVNVDELSSKNCNSERVDKQLCATFMPVYPTIERQKYCFVSISY